MDKHSHDFEDTLGQRHVRIVDTTLRDGEQAPGVVFNLDEKIEIAGLLAEAGVDEIEAGIPAMGDTACKEIRKLVELELPCTLSSWCRATKKDIEMAATCKTQGVHISFPTSSILLKTFDKTRSWVLSALEELVGFAKKHFSLVSVGAQDATRTDFKFLTQFAKTAYELDIDCLRLADTVGFVSPVVVLALVKKMNAAVPNLCLEFHGHNDLGMATANAVSAVNAGVGSISVTVNGLGERAGNTPLEEVSVALFGLQDYVSNMNLSSLPKLCRAVAMASGQDISVSKPIVGKNIFNHESGIHCAGLLKNPLSYQLFDPKMVGRTPSELIIGTHSGGAGIHHLLLNHGIEITRTQADRLIPLVKEKSRAKKRNLSFNELKGLYKREFA